MEILGGQENPGDKETMYQRRLRMQLLVAAGAKIENRWLSGVEGSGLYFESPRGQVIQI